MSVDPAPESREQAERRIAWEVDDYARHGFGLWLPAPLDQAG